MSSRDATAGIPLSHAPDDLGFKLLELPPELVALVESDAPPPYVCGTRRSATQFTTKLTQKNRMTLRPSATAALLEAGGKTYSLRQKNTSNALVLLAVVEGGDVARHGGEDEATGGEKGPSETGRAGLCAVATVHETVELVPETDGSAAPKVASRGRWHERFGSAR